MSIVAGLGIARILSGFATLIEIRQRIQFDWVTNIWAVNVLGYHLLFWWIVVNDWRALPVWTFLRFSSLFPYGVLLFFCATLILPRQLVEEMDLKAGFETIRRPFYILWLLVMCFELLDSLQKGTEYVKNELGPAYLSLWAFSVLLSLTGTMVSNRRYHLAAAIGFFTAYSTWTISTFATVQPSSGSQSRSSLGVD